MKAFRYLKGTFFSSSTFIYVFRGFYNFILVLSFLRSYFSEADVN